MNDDFGWGGDHVGKLIALQTAVRKLAGQGKLRDRYDAATFALATYHERDFPEHLRPAFNRIMEARRKAREDVNENYAYFAFDALTPTERKQVVADITALYEACLIDIGRSWPQWDFMYPKGDLLPKPVRRRRKKKET
ncbi:MULTISPECIES: hypothetical protein [unclassified Bradyrhizobium]|uniref:hypothetical protein n=1 Tax=unclassified Bradyrhizobium TaxID=2631580 RepID=UPI002916DAF6|nr:MULTISPECIES: hypothetical protein [unclassified Bradyrhizobium]